MPGTVLPLLPLRGVTVFPYMVLHFDVGRNKSIAALEEAMVKNQLIFLVTQKDSQQTDPTPADIFEVGTISRVKQLLKLPGDSIRVLVEGITRASIIRYTKTEPFFEAELAEDPQEPNADAIGTEALMRTVMRAFSDFARGGNKVSPETLTSLGQVTDAGQFADIIAANILVKQQDKQEVLSEFKPKERLEKLLEILQREIEIQNIENRISSRVRKQIDKSQKEYYLREQIKAIQKELGEKDAVLSETDELREKIDATPLSEEAREKALAELNRFSKMPSASPELPVIRTYIDWILSLPWGVETADNMDLENARKILDEDHYGLKKVKERLVEYLAVRQLKDRMKGPILCFLGPPGVGKTSIARSIARALNRKFVRMSLGGVRDEAEIRGHRRTYIGAIPGRIIAGMKQAGSMNPVFLFDEIDKMSTDFRGDPASAMLEVLDAEQNNSFRDHYLDIAFDLSKVMFLTTANSADTIPRPLLDRMEIIELSSYTEDEKLGIAKRHLVPKQIKEHGLKEENLTINDKALSTIITRYTSEPGVRNLEREIATVCRKAAIQFVEGKKTILVNERNLTKYLGRPRYRDRKAEQQDTVGLATGLAWTPVGGQTLNIEVTHMKGTGKIELTGHLGDVMKESALAGYSYIRSHAMELGIAPGFHEKLDLHIHVPEGATPKDGPSAGVTMATAMVSALNGIPVRSDVAMTGEITLRGRVLPIGGLKEKLLAAHRAGIRTVLIPAENERDLEDIPAKVRRKLEIIAVSDMGEILKVALAGQEPAAK